MRSTPEYDLVLHVSAAARNGAGTADARARILREIARLEKAIESSERQLGDATFLARAPQAVIEQLRAKLASYQQQLKKNRELLDNLD
jgi:valyl-tRNA synthetase